MICVEWTGKAWGTNRRLERGKYGNIYANRNYEGFETGLTYLLMSYNAEKRSLAGSVRVHLDFTINTARDIDSLIKPVLDCLQKARVVRNDSQITRLFVSKTPKKKRGEEDRIRVTVEEIA